MTKARKQQLARDNNARALQCNYQPNLKRYHKGQLVVSMKSKSWNLYK